MEQQLQHHRDLIQKALRATTLLYLLVILNNLIRLARSFVDNSVLIFIPLIQLFCSVLIWRFARFAIIWNQQCKCGLTNLEAYHYILWAFLIISLADLITNIVLYIDQEIVLALVGAFVNLFFFFLQCVNIFYVRQLVVDNIKLKSLGPDPQYGGTKGDHYRGDYSSIDHSLHESDFSWTI
mmetsp:Transcript_23101/g.39090  ORF Transcript_23101/g.39090 Transcript_23101/m.39090 type:complete len:181 (+) Transcript_23101:82-624(+)